MPEADDPTAEDLAMAQALDQALPKELAEVRERGKNWVGALTALTGLLAVTTVLKGPETTTDLVWWYRLFVALLSIGGLVVLALGVRSAYTAAYGAPGEELDVNRSQVTGLYARVLQIRERAADAARATLKRGLTQGLAGVALVMAATLLTWFPVTSAGTTSSTCVLVNGTQVLKVKAASLPVSASGATVELKGC